MKIAFVMILSVVCGLVGCGEIIFGSPDDYQLGATSCRSLAAMCGEGADRQCCESPIVTGGTNDDLTSFLAQVTVSEFRLDRFEVTVGRFREFVAAYPTNKPADGHGAHERIPQSGWNPEWNSALPATQSDLTEALHCSQGLQTWTNEPGNNEAFPINCVDWYMAFAFCAWDGGRLPTEAEWNHSAVGGNERRVYPWSAPSDSIQIDETFAVYDCRGSGTDPFDCSMADILPVGAKSTKGIGRFGQLDLAGSMREWMLDAYQIDPMTECTNCARISRVPQPRVLRGGAWDLGANELRNEKRTQSSPAFRFHDIGFRCARAS